LDRTGALVHRLEVAAWLAGYIPLVFFLKSSLLGFFFG
jgi:hypothetical protein